MSYITGKPSIRYRFKDRMNCVFFRDFRSDWEAEIWHERNKFRYAIEEYGSVGKTHKENKINFFTN